MNAWTWAAAALLAALVPLAGVAARRPPLHGLVALEVAGTLVTAALLLLAEGTHRQSFGDLALVAAVSSFVGALAFLRFLERVP